MTNYSIQKASFDDFPIIQKIAFATWYPTYGHILTQEQSTFMLDMMYSETSMTQQFNNNQFLIFYDNEKPVGFAGFENKGEVMKLHKIYFLPETQGKGFGKTMIEEIAQISKAAGCKYLELNVNRNNKAKNFYEKQGFEVFKEEDIDIGNGYWMNDYVMRKVLF